MASRNRALVLEIVADTDKSSRQLQGFTSKIKGLGLGFLAAFGAREVIGAIGDTIAAASDLGESVNAVGKVFQDEAYKVEAFGRTAAQAVGLSKREVNELAVTVGGQLKNLGMEDFADQTLILTQRAADMASVFNTDVSTAVTAIASGLRGESEPLRKFNVNLSRSAIVAKAAADGITEAQAAVALIMEQTADTAGDFADTSTGLANASRTLAAEWENLQAAAGQYLEPTAAAIVSFLATIPAGRGQDFAGDFLVGLNELNKGLATAAEGVVGLFTFGQVDLGWNEQANEMQKLLQVQNTYNQRLREGQDVTQTTAKAFLELSLNHGITEDGLAELIPRLGRTQDELRDSAKLALENAEAYGLSADEIALLDEAYQRSKVLTKEYSQSFAEYTSQIAQDANDNLVDDADSATAAVERMRQRWEDTFTDLQAAWDRLQLTPKKASLDLVTIGIGDDRPADDTPYLPPENSGGGSGGGSGHNPVSVYVAPGSDPYATGQAIADAMGTAAVVGGLVIT